MWNIRKTRLRRTSLNLGLLGLVMVALGLAGCLSLKPEAPLERLSECDLGGTQWLNEIEKSPARNVQGVDPPKSHEAWQVGSEVIYSIRIEGRGEPVLRSVHFVLRSGSLRGVKVV